MASPKIKQVVLGVCGSIAAYKAGDIIRRLQEINCEVTVIMTREAAQFITPLTLACLSGKDVYNDMFDKDSWRMPHITLAKAADIILIAPATANVIGKLANGSCDDLLTTFVISSRAPVLIAPAMNDEMYANEIVRGNCAKLKMLSNADMEKIVATTDEWIRERTGITERHVAEKGVATSHLASAAAKTLLEQTGTAADEIDLIIVATVTPDMLFPATACLVQNRIGASKAWGFDLSGACSGFLYALTVGAQFVGAGTHQKALVIGSDKMTLILDYGDRSTCVLFGDGAGAVLIEPAASDAEGILDFHHDIDGSGGEFLFMPGGGSLNPPSHETVDQKMHCVHQVGPQVFKYAVRRMADVACQLIERNGYSTKDVKIVVPHQANLRIIRAMQERLGVDDSKILININRYANTTAGTIPLGLRDAVEQKRLCKGDLVLLVSVGAGYTTGGVLMRWAY